MVTSPGNPEDFEQNKPISIQREQPLSLQPVIDNSPLAKRARIRAVDDIEDIKALIEKDGPVTILDDHVHKRATTLAKEEVKNSYPPDDPPDPTEYRKRVERWKAAYLDQLEEERKSIARDLKSFPDTKAVNLARKAREDRRKYMFAPFGRGPFHQRDLAVVSTLHELELCQSLEEYLGKIHTYVDIYEEAFRNSKEEVVWPDPASF